MVSVIFIDHLIIIIFSKQLGNFVEFLHLYTIPQFIADEFLNLMLLLLNLFERYPHILTFLLQVDQFGQYHVPYHFIVGQLLCLELLYLFD